MARTNVDIDDEACAEVMRLDVNASMTQRIRPTLFAMGTVSTLFPLLMIGLFLVIYTLLAKRTR